MNQLKEIYNNYNLSKIVKQGDVISSNVIKSNNVIRIELKLISETFYVFINKDDNQTIDNFYQKENNIIAYKFNKFRNYEKWDFFNEYINIFNNIKKQTTKAKDEIELHFPKIERTEENSEYLEFYNSSINYLKDNKIIIDSITNITRNDIIFDDNEQMILMNHSKGSIEESELFTDLIFDLKIDADIFIDIFKNYSADYKLYKKIILMSAIRNFIIACSDKERYYSHIAIMDEWIICYNNICEANGE